MRRQLRLAAFPLAGLALALAAVLAFLYARARDYDHSKYFENVALLRQIQQVDANSELDALKSKFGINADYDPLATRLAELNSLQERLDRVLAEPGAAALPGLAAAGAAFRRAVRDKTGRLEQFKSHNAVLRNSLDFLPTAASDVRRAAQRAAGGDARALRRVSEQAGKLLLMGLEFNQSGSGGQAVEIEVEIERLLAGSETLPAEVGDALDTFAAHMHTLLHEHLLVGDLLKNIAAVQLTARVGDIERLLAAEQHTRAREAERYRRYLLLFSAALIGLLLYVAICLIRSHAVIRRVNGELREANEGLEKRVQERTEQLRATQGELLSTARRAGMAEIASNVLHNVGNVLNSVNVSAGLIASRVRDSKAEGLARAVELLDQHAGDLGAFLGQDPKGKLLPGYLARLAATLAAERQSLLAEIGHLSTSLDHIKEVVSTQQSYARGTGVVEPVRLQDLMEDALRMHAGGLSRHEVTVVRQFAEVPVLALDKHRLLQILINLIGNAKQAMAGMAGRPQRLTLACELAAGPAGQRLLIRVADEGEGIAPENLTRIFSHGFTTRRNGHGFGLHSSALAAREMGGSLSAHSDGPGQGAVFTLELPVRPAMPGAKIQLFPRLRAAAASGRVGRTRKHEKFMTDADRQPVPSRAPRQAGHSHEQARDFDEPDGPG